MTNLIEDSGFWKSLRVWLSLISGQDVTQVGKKENPCIEISTVN